MSSLSVPGFIWYHGVLHPTIRGVVGAAHRTLRAHRRGADPAVIYAEAKRISSRLIDHFSLDLQIMNAEDLPAEPGIVVANHVSTIDVLALTVLPGEHYFAPKASLFSYPLLGKAMRAVGMPPIERGSSRSIESLIEGAALIKQRAIDYGSSRPYLDIFVEGTRNPEGYDMQKFKRGAFIASLKEEVPLLPIVMYGAQELMPKTAHRILPGKVCVLSLGKMDYAAYALPEEIREKPLKAFLGDRLAKEAVQELIFDTRVKMIFGLQEVESYAKST